MSERPPPRAAGRLRLTAVPLVVLSTALVVVAGCSTPGSGPAGEPDGLPSVSAPLALTQDGRTLWVVNPDADSVTAVNTASLRASAPLSVGAEPWSVAVAANDALVVMNRESGSLAVIHDGRRTDVGVGAEPGGLALSPTGRFAFVTLSSDAALAIVDLERLEVIGRVPLGARPWAVGVTDDGDADDLDETVVVTHRIARLRDDSWEGVDDGKEGWLTTVPAADIVASTSGAASTRGGASATGGGDARLPTAVEHALEPYGFGFVNGLEALDLRGGTAYVAHLLNSPEYPRDFETTVSAALSGVALEPSGLSAGAASLRLHLNDESFSTPVNHPTGVALSADGLTAYLTLGGSDAVMGVDLSGATPRLIGFWPTGSNPRGLVLSPDGERAYVMNYLSRDVSVLDLSDHAARQELARVAVAPETLTADQLRGKVLFHAASSSRISQLGWIACATCHLGGGSDGTTWQTPDGPRQTMPLWELQDTAPFHASATRDEVQDFEQDIEELMAGSGLAPGAFRAALGEPNGGLSHDLDTLAEYVLRGIRIPTAPEVDAGLASEGRALYADLGCVGCHGGPHWTRSALPGPVGSLAPDGEVEVVPALRDVGTFSLDQDVLGASGFDVPTLLGLHASAPYLHDGSAATLAAVLASERHVGRSLGAHEVAALTAFLRSVDAGTPPF